MKAEATEFRQLFHGFIARAWNKWWRHVRSDNISLNEVHHGILFDRSLVRAGLLEKNYVMSNIMVWTTCSLKIFQLKVLSRVVIVFRWPNVFLCINLFVKSSNSLKRILTLKVSMAYFLMRSLPSSKSVRLTCTYVSCSAPRWLLINCLCGALCPLWVTKRFSCTYKDFPVFSPRWTFREELLPV